MSVLYDSVAKQLRIRAKLGAERREMTDIEHGLVWQLVVSGRWSVANGTKFVLQVVS